MGLADFLELILIPPVGSSWHFPWGWLMVSGWDLGQGWIARREGLPVLAENQPCGTVSGHSS